MLNISRIFPICAIVSIGIFSCSKTSENPTTMPPIVIQPVVVPPVIKPVELNFGNGVNVQPSYYNDGTVNFGWDLMKKYTKIKTVRIEIEPDKINQGKHWIQEAITNGYSVIATYHKYKVLGSDDATEVMLAANWWKANYLNLSASGAFTINLINEWGSHKITPKAYADAYNSAIAVVRTVYSGNIIIDCPGYGQETTTVSQAVMGTGVGGVKITDTNIILSAHIYKNGYNQVKGRSVNQSDVDDLLATSRACIIGEFGDQPADGSVDWSGIVTYAKSKGFKVLGWCWNGDGGTMNMVSPAWSTNANPPSFSISTPYFNTIYDSL
ncbi:mannan endo-1,4-beta-mannosidase [Pedobacter sp. UYEF25]